MSWVDGEQDELQPLKKKALSVFKRSPRIMITKAKVVRRKITGDVTDRLKESPDIYDSKVEKGRILTIVKQFLWLNPRIKIEMDNETLVIKSLK